MERYWFEVAVISFIFAAGGIFFGHFEEGVPRWRRLLKLIAINVLAVTITATAGREWFYALLAVFSVLVLLIHGWWLPKNGINGLTGEPRERYYRLRGWDWPPPK
jgi:hypothetical protein